MMQEKGPVLEDRWSEDYATQPSDKRLVEATALPNLPLASFVFTMPVGR
jgi:hypothetical protein